MSDFFDCQDLADDDFDAAVERLSGDLYYHPDVAPNSFCSQCYYWPLSCSGPRSGCLRGEFL